MKAQDFLSWMETTGYKSAADIVRHLDVGRNLAQRWLTSAQAGEDLPIKKTVALAMTAAANGLLPWDELER